MGGESSVTDRALLARISSGGADADQAFEQLYLAYFDKLIRFALRLLYSSDAAYDAVQDVFVKLWEQRAQIRLNNASLKTYLYSAVRNRAINVMQHNKIVERTATDNTIEWYRRSDVSPSDNATHSELERDVMSFLANLPERQLTALQLRWDDQLNWTEIAEVMRISESAARKLARKAGEKLQELRTKWEK